MWRSVCLVCALILTGCSNQSQYIDRGEYIVDQRSIKEPWLSKPNNYLVFHYTALNDEASLRVLTAGGVSVQYLVPTIPAVRDGKPVVCSWCRRAMKPGMRGKVTGAGKAA